MSVPYAVMTENNRELIPLTSVRSGVFIVDF